MLCMNHIGSIEDNKCNIRKIPGFKAGLKFKYILYYYSDISCPHMDWVFISTGKLYLPTGCANSTKYYSRNIF